MKFLKLKMIQRVVFKDGMIVLKEFKEFIKSFCKL